MASFKPRSDVIEAFQYLNGVTHPIMRRNEVSEPEGGPPLGGDDTVPIGPNGQRRSLEIGDYVIIQPDGICRVMAPAIFEAVYIKTEE